MALIKQCRGFEPQIGEDCWIAENATLVGDLIIGKQCSVWFNAVVRADVNSIRIGNRVNIQDGAVLHCTYEKTKVDIGTPKKLFFFRIFTILGPTWPQLEANLGSKTDQKNASESTLKLNWFYDSLGMPLQL